MWYTKYIGIPYKDKGRDTNGLDCWGLAREVYSKEYNIDLPSFSTNYIENDTIRIQELLSQYKEGWEKESVPTEGSIVLFRILGTVSHVGIMINDTQFIHNNRKIDTCIESINNIKWKNRIAGFYKYSTNSATSLTELPVSLKTIAANVPEGLNLGEILAWVVDKENIIDLEKTNVAIIIDGTLVEVIDNNNYIPKAGQTIEYRIVPTGGALRTLLTIAVMVVVYTYAAPLAAYMTGTATAAASAASIAAGTGALTVVSAGAVFATTAVMNLVGMALVNAIAPIRMGDSTSSVADPGTSNPQLMLTGSRNELRAYQAIPVVLGKYRIIAPLAAQTYLRISDETSYLNMLLTWGYGPVLVEDIRVGAGALSNYAPKQFSVYGNAGDSVSGLYDIYGKDTYQISPNLPLVYDNLDTDWQNVSIPNKSNKVSITLHFPEGLRLVFREGENAGAIYSTLFMGQVQIRGLSDNLVPTTSWLNSSSTFSNTTINIQPVSLPEEYITPPDMAYQWHIVYVSSSGLIQVAIGDYVNQDNMYLASANYLTQNMMLKLIAATDLNLYSISLQRVTPDIPADSFMLYKFRRTGTVNSQLTDYRGTNVIGGSLAFTTNTLTISSGTRTVVDTIYYGGSASSYYKRKDAFSTNIEFDGLPYSKYEVRVRRTNSAESDLSTTANKPYLYHKAILYLITAIDGTKNPVIPPKNTNLALTALEIQATDQLSGSIDGINALVSSICLDYNLSTNTWINRPTSNPASLFRYILQHPANTQRILESEVSTKLDLTALQEWHTFCNTKGYTYNAVVVSQRGLLDLMKDICAAGRGSPLLSGGKWTVLIDQPRSSVIQHFTPHNSWGFEGNRTLANMPDALRVTFINAAVEYQSEELIVYNDGFSSTNATVFEALELPGVTNASQAYKLARFHLAQVKLRPESYSLNADIEYLACNRGDLVRVSHDTPMWGIGSGRIKNYINSTQIQLDEEALLDANTNYTIRIRTSTGASVLRNIVPVSTQDYYSIINVTLAVSLSDAAPGNLFMLGLSNSDSVELVVISIEPSNNLTAKITLADYSPGIYTADAQAIPAFNTQITRPSAFARDFILSIPSIDTLNIKSDESVMEKSGSSYIYKLVVPFNSKSGLETGITNVDGRACLTRDTSLGWRDNLTVKISEGNILFSNLIEGEEYSIQLRYSNAINGFAGPWTTEVTHTIVGKTNPPALVNSSITVVPEGDKLRLTWSKNTEIDLAGYEVREVEATWGGPGALFIGNSNTCLVTPGPAGISKNWYIRAYDGTNLFSVSSTVKAFIVLAPSAPTNISATYSGITSALFKWTAAVPGSFAIRNYRVTLTGIGLTTISTVRDTTDWEVPITWANAVTLTIVPIDAVGNEYTGTSNTLVLALNVPSTPSLPAISISGTDIVLDWADNAISTSQIPVEFYEIYNSDSTLVWKGAVSKAIISMIGLSGTKNYTLVARDYKNQISAVRNISYLVPAPSNVLEPSLTNTFGSSLTDASLTLNWADVSNAFGLSGYEVSYNSTIITTSSNTLTISPLPVNWIGDKVFTVKTLDLIGNKSIGTAKTITKSKPDTISSVRADVIDNNVMLYWDLPVRTTLPIDHVIVRKTQIMGIPLAIPENVGEKSGTFTTIFERQANTYTYEIAAVDTDKKEGLAYPLTVTVSQPPDFIFNGNFTSQFTGTVNNARIDANLDTGIYQVTMPIDTVSTIAEHFDTRGWVSPQNQIDALYPIYSQPSLASGYYEELVDFGTIIGSSQVTITTTGTVVSGTPVVITTVSYSADNLTYSAISASSLLFISNFRYIKVRVTVSQVSSDKAIYALNYVNIRLDSKIKDDAGGVVCDLSHSLGTVANFSREFVDVTSIAVSPNSTSPIMAVYDYLDTVIPASYNIVSNICSVTTSAPHGFSSIAGASGQKVRLDFTSGTGISKVYTVSSVISTTQYTVSIVTSNTSGNCSSYSQGMRIYLYNTSGVRVSGPASWAIKGY